MKWNSIFPAGIGLLSAVLFSACSGPDLARVQVHLIDAPADYGAVNIDVADIQVNIGDSDEGWQSLDEANPGVYNLLELTNGASALLGEVSLPEGSLAQVRLVLGENNSLETNGETIPLSIPSGAETGLKVLVNSEIMAGASYQLVLDFDAARSVVENGNANSFALKPVIRGTMDPLTGGIKGTIMPDDVPTTVYALVGSDTITSAYTDDTGAFLLSHLDEGTYTVVAEPASDSGYKSMMTTGITVAVGNITDMHMIALPQK